MTREECIRIYSKYSRKLFNVSFRIVGDSALAEEIMQDTILKFIRFFDEGKMADQVGPDDARKATGAWLVRTCVRGSIDALRRMKRDREFLEEYAAETEEAGSPEVEVGQITIETVKKEMDSLPEPYRLILTLVLIEGLDYEEISEITGVKEGALRTRFSRARKMLADRLGKGR